MVTLTLDLPTLYGDHHVIEVRALLAGLPGVRPLVASSAWQAVELEYDPARITPADIRAALAARGYTADPGLPAASARRAGGTEFALGPGAVEQFAETTPAWEAPGPCPGFSVLRPGAGQPADPGPGAPEGGGGIDA